jgi:hypothetical protein
MERMKRKRVFGISHWNLSARSFRRSLPNLSRGYLAWVLLLCFTATGVNPITKAQTEDPLADVDDLFEWRQIEVDDAGVVAWSPDGRYIAVLGGSRNDMHIEVIAWDGQGDTWEVAIPSGTSDPSSYAYTLQWMCDSLTSFQ